MKKKMTLFFLIILFFSFALFHAVISYAIDEKEEVIETNMLEKNVEEKEDAKEGIYYISTAINDKYIFDIEDASKANEAKLQIWEKYKLSNNQKFKIKSTGDGYYTIEIVHSGKVLDIPGAGMANGTKVQQYTNNGTDAQKWKILKNTDGTYSIMSKCNGLYLDIPGAIAKNGVRLQVYEGNGTQAQKFKLYEIKEEVIEGKQTIEDGIYKIKTSSNKSIVLDVDGLSRANGANVQIWTESNLITKNQRFKVTHTGNGYYEIIAQHSEKALDVAGAGTTNGTNIQQYTSNGTDAQRWVIRENTDGTYSIQSKANGLYIDVARGLIQNGSNIQMYEGNGSPAQKFIFEKVEKPKCGQILEDGIYKISTALNSNMSLDIEDGSYNNQAKLHIWEGDIVQQKKFELKYNKEGYYEIINVNSGKVLDVAGGSNSNGAKVQQYESNNTEYQKWILQDAGNGYFYIVSRGAEAYLDIAGGKASNGTKVQIYDGNGSTAQKFKLEKTQIIDNKNYQITIADNEKIAVDVDLVTSNTQIWEINSNSLNQKFQVEHVDEGYYKIICKATSKVLTVENKKDVKQKEYIDSDNQKWKIEIGNNGYYYIKSKGTGQYLEVANGSTNNGTNIQVSEWKGTNSQKFRFNIVKGYQGIDVSYHNGKIDWAKVKKAGIDFAIIRCGYGQNLEEQDDSRFNYNVSECERLGIPYGVYLYSYALNTDNALSEADHVLRLLNGRKPQFGIWIDIEDDEYYTKYGFPSNEDFVNIATTFCEKIKANGYENVGIYSNLEWFNGRLNDNRLDKYDKWVAQWGNECTYNKNYIMWQYSDSGKIDGITGNVDMNISYKKQF